MERTASRAVAEKIESDSKRTHGRSRIVDREPAANYKQKSCMAAWTRQYVARALFLRFWTPKLGDNNYASACNTIVECQTGTFDHTPRSRFRPEVREMTRRVSL